LFYFRKRQIDETVRNKSRSTRPKEPIFLAKAYIFKRLLPLKGERLTINRSVLLLLIALFVLGLSSSVMAQANSIWLDNLTYSSYSEFQAAGWTSARQEGVSFSADGVLLDATQVDTSISYSGKFLSGLYDWTVEDRSRWTLGSHSGNSVFGSTQLHTYGFAADGWYGYFAFYRDGQKILTFGSYQEQSRQWFTLRMEKHGNQIDMYFNGNLEQTYTETDKTPSELIAVSINAPWLGGAEYDYIQLWSPDGGSNNYIPSEEVMKTAWVPPPVNGASATVFAVAAVSVSSLVVAAATTTSTGMANGFLAKLVDKFRELIPETIKKWLENFISSKRKLKVDEKTGSPYLPTKSELLVYGISLVFSTFAFSYVKVSNFQDLWIILPTFFATSILVYLVKTYILSVYARRKGVWTENKLWYFGLGLFLFSTVAFRMPFSSPTRTVHHSKNFSQKLSGFLACAAIFITLGFGAFFFILYKVGFVLVGGTGLAMCLISAFFDTFPIEPMHGSGVYKYNKRIWLIIFATTLALYIAWIAHLL